MIVEDFKSGRLTTDGAMATVKKRLDAKPDDHLAKLLAIVIQKEKGEDEALIRGCRELADAMKPDSPKNKAIILWLKGQMAMTAHTQEQSTRRSPEALRADARTGPAPRHLAQ